MLKPMIECPFCKNHTIHIPTNTTCQFCYNEFEPTAPTHKGMWFPEHDSMLIRPITTPDEDIYNEMTEILTAYERQLPLSCIHGCRNGCER